MFSGTRCFCCECDLQTSVTPSHSSVGFIFLFREDLHPSTKTMWAMILISSCLLSFYGFTSAQVPFFGACPAVKTVSDFDLAKYLGKWYEAERYFSIFEFAGKCISANYTDSGDGRLNIINRQTSYFTGIHSTMEGEVIMTERSDSGKLNVRFPQLPLVIDAPYWVLGTDYENYAVVWSCTNFGILSTRNAWILTRERNPTLEVMESAYSVIDKNEISRAYFIRTDQNNCPENH